MGTTIFNLKKREAAGRATDRSKLIEWAEAKEMIKAYWIHPDNIRIPIGDPRVLNVLKGFSFNAADVRQVLDTGVEQLFVMIAVRGEDVDKPKDQQYFTLILGGIDSHGKLLQAPLYDYCEPCPDKCPVYPSFA